MKNYFLIKTGLFLFILLYSHQLFAQDYFRGSIEYELNIEVHDPNIAVEQLKQDFGTGSIFYYQDGNNLQTYKNSASIEFDFLDSKTKKYYVKYPNNDTLYVQDATINNEESIVNSKISKTNKVILNHKCEKFEIKALNKLYVMEYQLSFLFTKQIEINSEHFTGLKKGSLEDVYESINSIPLEMKISNNMFTTISTAVKINKEKSVPLEEMFKEMTKGLVLKEVKF